MDLELLLPLLLGLAWLVPLGSFAAIVFFGPRMGRAGRGAGYLAIGAIGASAVFSIVALIAWLLAHPLGGDHGSHHPVHAVAGDWYPLAVFGDLKITIGYYIDGLTVAMFAMVSVVALCIHVYSLGYMHEELHDVTDPLVMLSDGQPLKRRGRFHRFFQYLSLFSFSMLGLVLAGNVAMVFVFWELVGICSYLLIGFYIERKSASNAANKAFIVNRVGDFGMIVGMMALWSGLGTFSFDEIFARVRPAANGHALVVPDGMVRAAASKQIAEIYQTSATGPGVSFPGLQNAAEAKIAALVPSWRAEGLGYGLLLVAGLGVFCGCVGKSAQFPLHVWLPDAMEGPTPVSALIHAATMVAAGVYLVGRFYPVFTPEALLVIAIVGCITLLIAATIALTATDIKRVLAYSTVSQLGYMMLALGVGGWVAGLFHLFTHAFFKALLFLCSGSVIHATGTNEMPRMGGLLKKMPWTAGTMLVGCLAISGAGIPLVIGLSGYYSKDGILAQLYSFAGRNPSYAWLFYAAAGGAALTAFYMFRLWFMTFLGVPRDEHIHAHAHESPRVMVVPLVILAVFAVVAGWNVPGTALGLQPLLEQARPLGTAEGASQGRLLPTLTMPAEHLSHAHEIHVPVTLIAFSVGLAGFLLASAMYWWRVLDADLIGRTFWPLYEFLRNKWWFDELYQVLFVRPVLRCAALAAAIDRAVIDGAAHALAAAVRLFSRFDDWIDRLFVDGAVNAAANVTYEVGLRLREVQTGQLRQYVLWVAAGTVGLFVLAMFLWTYTLAG
jgi:proton-translocating NADH-quinone oxidoreductase chain L